MNGDLGGAPSNEAEVRQRRIERVVMEILAAESALKALSAADRAIAEDLFRARLGGREPYRIGLSRKDGA